MRKKAIPALKKDNPRPAFKGIVVRSGTYFPQTVSEWQGNLLIEVLAPQLERQVVRKRLRSRPVYSESDRLLSANDRISLTKNTRRFVEPMDLIVHVERSLNNAIRWGYVDRNPMDPRYTQTKRKAMSMEDFMKADLPALPRGADCMLIYGDPGTGKTTAIERVLLLQPQVIEHIWESSSKDRTFTEHQLVWLKLNCPSNGSLKQLVISFFKTVDAVLGTNYVSLYAITRRSTEEMIFDMTVVAQRVHLGVLVIDEIQNLNAAHSGGSAVVMNFFVTLVDSFSVPVLLVGTHQAVQLFQREFRLARRFTGQGNIMSKRMEPGLEWTAFIEQLWPIQYTATPTALTDDHKVALFNVSQGIADIACKVYMLAQIRAIINRKKKGDLWRHEGIPVELIYQVAFDSMHLTKDVLQALRTARDKNLKTPNAFVHLMGDFELTGKAVDLFVEQAQDAEINLKSIEELRELASSDDPALQTVAAMARGTQMPRTIVLEAVRLAVQGLGSTASALELLPVATVEAEKLVAAAATRPKPRGKRPNNAGLVLVELVEAGETSGLSGHQALLNAGLIQTPFGAAGLPDEEPSG